jgi:cytoskeletal protein CcmA (bactofilin family)
LLGAALALVVLVTPFGDGFAKAPGEMHCYGGICHRVLTLAEAQRLIGLTSEVVTSHYDHPNVDRFNVGKYTSSGEEFDADNAARAASANLPDGTEILLWHPGTWKAAHVRINDFGPFRGNRTLDVTRAVAEVLGFARAGVATLKVTVIWVPGPDTARYRKARNYVPSQGPIGFITPGEHDALIRQLVMTAAERNFVAPPDIVIAGAPLLHVPSRSVEQVMADEAAAASRPETITAALDVATSDVGPKAGLDDMTPIPELEAGATISAFAGTPPRVEAASFQAPVTVATAALSKPPFVERLFAWTTRKRASLTVASEQMFWQVTMPWISLSALTLLALLIDRKRFAGPAPVRPRRLKPNDAEPAASALPVATLPSYSRFDTRFSLQGDVTSASALWIDGRIAGNCQAPLIVIGPSAVIDGNLAAEMIVVQGAVRGSLYARQISIAASATIDGEVAAEWLDMAEGAWCEATVSRLSSMGDFRMPELRNIAAAMSDASSGHIDKQRQTG